MRTLFINGSEEDLRAYGLQMDRHTLAIFSNTEYEWFFVYHAISKKRPITEGIVKHMSTNDVNNPNAI